MNKTEVKPNTTKVNGGAPKKAAANQAMNSGLNEAPNAPKPQGTKEESKNRMSLCPIASRTFN